MFDSRDIARIGAMQEAVRVGLLVETNEIARAQHQFDQTLVLAVRSVTPFDSGGFGQRSDLVDPCGQFGVLGHYWYGSRGPLPVLGCMPERAR